MDTNSTIKHVDGIVKQIERLDEDIIRSKEVVRGLDRRLIDLTTAMKWNNRLVGLISFAALVAAMSIVQTTPPPPPPPAVLLTPAQIQGDIYFSSWIVKVYLTKVVFIREPDSSQGKGNASAPCRQHPQSPPANHISDDVILH
jgi:hypothetical protein